jgi:magnesium-transporting ATPase (P-type)
LAPLRHPITTLATNLCTLLRTPALTRLADLNTELRSGLTTSDADTRRKRYGYNEISSEKTNLLKQFVGYFTGPILYG